MTKSIEKIAWNIEDLSLIPFNESIYYEIINGELFVTRSPHRKHQQICGKIFKELDTWNESKRLGEVIIFPGIIFSDADNVSPDVIWVSHEKLQHIEDEAGHLTGAPELVIEVLSPGKENYRRDKEVKLKLYSNQGVEEYWIVDRFLKQLEVYRRENSKLILVATFLNNDKITSPNLPLFSCAISKFFR